VPVPFIFVPFIFFILTNELSDFKFKHHSTGLKYSEELGRYIYE